MTVLEKLAALRAAMKSKGLDAWGTANSDPHASEYTSEHYCTRKFLSGFTGSAGTLVVTADDAALFTDGRYVVQAAKQLEGSSIRMILIGGPGEPSMEEWLKERIPGGVLGWDFATMPTSQARAFSKKLKPAGITLADSGDLADPIWSDRPALPHEPAWILDVKYAGRSVAEKLADLRRELVACGATAQLLVRLEDTAWLFNIRGNDVPCLPVTHAFSLVTLDRAMLFLQEGTADEAVKSVLTEAGVELLPYDAVGDAVAALSVEDVLALDPDKVSRALFARIPCEVTEQEDITTLMKSVKNEVEMANIRASGIRDGVAMVKFLYWLDHTDRAAADEVTVADKLVEYRSQDSLFVETSFNTIAAYKDHGAMMHYSATPETAYSLAGDGVMVVDSGATYYDGTTDITRTPVLGEISREMIEDYTLVLRSHIALASARFLEGATAATLDVLARRPLWEVGLEYRCGTGHGVGFCLSVHEPPRNFSQKGKMIPLKAGNLMTVEPGIYREGLWGIRLENDVLVVEDGSNEYGTFYRFEPVTWCPMDLRGIDPELLDDKERAWINNYHAEVFEKLSPYFEGDELAWLSDATRAI